MLIRPRVGRSDRNSIRSSEVLPAPEGPVRNWNELPFDAEGEVAQHLRAEPVAQADILEPDHPPSSEGSRS